MASFLFLNPLKEEHSTSVFQYS